ncbi:hypothetical protein CEB94_14755 [Streptomyces hawaiiensis]|uniref:Uncharacterized protein n=1 Tax=Streptomyces hawaiiensis TaxID=67305 RepID=A0A6G5REH5_9ACTN|nr:hypothetical protein CEB94_14755 [Streptomyces hawaiiensis]
MPGLCGDEFSQISMRKWNSESGLLNGFPRGGELVWHVLFPVIRATGRFIPRFKLVSDHCVEEITVGARHSFLLYQQFEIGAGLGEVSHVVIVPYDAVQKADQMGGEQRYGIRPFKPYDKLRGVSLR